KTTNAKPASSEPAEEIRPYPAIHPEGSLEGRSRRPQQHRRKHSGDRRHDERRQKQVQVLLDTRLPYDRRTRPRRGNDRTNQRRSIKGKKSISYYI
ncbi:MAG: hypothetical protein OEX83_04275, partial [Gammaproteobacteria bacterium]|nr:hypothetical protein [Gammaproteobacteria bacterium]